MKWIEITVLTSQEAKEAATEVLYRAGAAGVVIEDADSPTLADDVEEYTPFASSLSLDEVRILAYLPESDSLIAVIESIRAEVASLWEYGLDPGKAEISTSAVEDEEWATAWKEHYKPMPIGKRLLIKPTWETSNPYPGRLVIELDPGMAFGTGTHETTAMCLELLEDIGLSGKRMIDMGCGSGILSIAAAHLGAGEVLALDYDPVAVKVAQENVVLNKVGAVVTVAESDLFSAASGSYDVIVANIIARIIVEAIPQVREHLSVGGLFLASGIIKAKEAQVIETLQAHGFRVIDLRESGEWVSILTCLEVQ